MVTELMVSSDVTKIPNSLFVLKDGLIVTTQVVLLVPVS